MQNSGNPLAIKRMAQLFSEHTEAEKCPQVLGAHPPPHLACGREVLKTLAQKFKYLVPKFKYVAPKFKHLAPEFK